MSSLAVDAPVRARPLVPSATQETEGAVQGAGTTVAAAAAALLEAEYEAAEAAEEAEAAEAAE